MLINSLSLDGFRNYGSFFAELSPSINVICGKNAQGKTNLLEAICLLAQGKSHRGAREAELIGFDRDMAVINAGITAHGRIQELEMTLRRGIRRTAVRNGAKLRRASELTGTLTAVMFEPGDLELVRGAPQMRRAELDSVIAQLRPNYAEALAEFNRLYTGKLRILKLHNEKPSMLYALDEYNDGLCRAGAKLIYYRAAFVKKLAVYAAQVHTECSGGLEKLHIGYVTERGVEIDAPDRAAIYKALTERQNEHRAREIAAGRCLTGAQRDDLYISINGLDARAYASQGQTRTAALSVKLAERDLIADDTGEAPVLLLDDVLSELDISRREFVKSRITGGQVLITTADTPEEAAQDGGKTLVIEAGRLVQNTV